MCSRSQSPPPSLEASSTQITSNASRAAVWGRDEGRQLRPSIPERNDDRDRRHAAPRTASQIAAARAPTICAAKDIPLNTSATMRPVARSKDNSVPTAAVTHSFTPRLPRRLCAAGVSHHSLVPGPAYRHEAAPDVRRAVGPRWRADRVHGPPGRFNRQHEPGQAAAVPSEVCDRRGRSGRDEPAGAGVMSRRSRLLCRGSRLAFVTPPVPSNSPTAAVRAALRPRGCDTLPDRVTVARCCVRSS